MNPVASRPVLALLLAVAGSAGVVAQAPAAATTALAAADRKPTFVRVLDAAGEPIAGAEVTFAGGNPQLGVEVQPVDVQVVASDARGRAQARLLPGLCYVAWALGAVTDGQQAASAPDRYFGAGAMLEVVCRPRPVGRLHRGETSVWADLGPLRYFLVTPHPGVEFELEPAVDGSISLPPLPSATLEVRTRDDEPLWSGAAHDFTGLLPPIELPVRAVDVDGAPLAGVRVRHRVARRSTWLLDGIAGLVQPRMREVGVTGADGRVKVLVPCKGDPIREFLSGPAELMLFADAPGRAVVAGGTYGRRLYVDDRRIEDAKLDELVFTLPTVEPLAAKAGLLPAGTTAQLVAVCKLWSRGNSYLHDARVFTAVVPEDGTLTFDNVPADVHSLRLCALLPAGPTPVVFAALDGRTLPPELVIGKPQQLRDRIGTVQVRALDVTGGPARGAVLCVVPANAGAVLQRDSVFQFPLDAGGQGALQLGPGRWVATIITPAGFCATAFDLPPETREIELRLQPLAAMRLQLRDSFGKPVVGARLRVAGSRTRSTADSAQNALRLFSRGLQAGWTALQTDGDGAMTVPFLPLDTVTWDVALSWPGGATEPFALEAAAEPIELSAK